MDVKSTIFIAPGNVGVVVQEELDNFLEPSRTASIKGVHRVLGSASSTSPPSSSRFFTSSRFEEDTAWRTRPSLGFLDHNKKDTVIPSVNRAQQTLFPYRTLCLLFVVAQPRMVVLLGMAAAARMCCASFRIVAASRVCPALGRGPKPAMEKPSMKQLRGEFRPPDKTYRSRDFVHIRPQQTAT